MWVTQNFSQVTDVSLDNWNFLRKTDEFYFVRSTDSVVYNYCQGVELENDAVLPVHFEQASIVLA